MPLKRWISSLFFFRGPGHFRGRAPHLGLGRRAERLAARHLKRQRYRILARNLRTSLGEIDMVAVAPDGRTVVIVEVKGGGGPTREAEDGGLGPRPEEHVTMAKQRRLAALAVQAVRRFNLTDRPIRFDVVAVIVPRQGRPIIRHWPGAFM